MLFAAGFPFAALAVRATVHFALLSTTITFAHNNSSIKIVD
jgi:hypothetical protein